MSNSISYIHPTDFTLISANLIPTTTNTHLSIRVTPLSTPSSSSFPTLNLSKPSTNLSTSPSSTLSTEFHTPQYLSPAPLAIYSSTLQLIPPSQYHTIPLNSTVSIQLTEDLHNKGSSTFYLTSIYIH